LILNGQENNDPSYFIQTGWGDENFIYIASYSNYATPTLTDDLLRNLSFEIRVYN
jgi:hypothetical protein